MSDFERSTTVGVSADAAFAFLSDPQRLPDYVPMVTLVDSTAVDGDLDVEADLQDRDGAAGAQFFADKAARRIEWGRSGSDYEGSAVVAEGTASTSQVTIRLHTRDDADTAEIERVLDQTLRNLRRHLSGR
jgi:carbon monoxide dehydrogenase subunit G